jgi:K+ transporter
VGLIDAAKGQKLVKLPEYLWIVSQIKAGDKAVLKVLKIAQDCLNSVESNQVSIILPSLTILANYIYHENRLSVLEELLNNTMFQNILILSLQTTSSIEISKEALFLCNNILAKSSHLSHKVMSSHTLMNAASMINCEEQAIFQKLTSIRSN